MRFGCVLVAPLLPLQVIGEGGGVASAIEAEDDGGDAVEQITVVGDQDERALELEESFFEDLQGGNVEVVGGLVEQEDIGGLEHEARDQDAGALSATEAADGLIELLGGEEKTVSPGRDVNHTVLEDDGIGVRRQGAAQGKRRIELALLLKVNDLEMIGGANGAGVGFELALQKTQQGGFSATVRADQPDTHSVGDDEIQSVEERALVVKAIGEVFDLDEALALASGAGEIQFGAGGASPGAEIAEFADEFVGAVDARFGFATAGLGTSAEPFDFGVDAVFEGLLMARLGVHPLLFHFEKVGVGAGDTENSVGIDAGEFGGFVGYVFEEITVVGDDDTGERGLGKKLFEPLDSGKVEVVGGLVEKQNLGGGDQGLSDGEALTPASGERLRVSPKSSKPARPRFMQARIALQGGNPEPDSAASMTW